jgi:hypothetical protein
VILLVLWAVGMFTAYTAGGLVHLLLVIAVIVDDSVITIKVKTAIFNHSTPMLAAEP